ncbi:hypothetical protein BGZ81_011001 [Podila clonocystis]|nr:hypothetical protein BGZ81_011001 [Podila clonocystis]
MYASALFPFLFSDYRGGNHNAKCLPSGTVREYQTFQLESLYLDSIVSKEPHDNILVGGIFGNKMLQELELCVVSDDVECNPPHTTDCIYEHVNYRFRVNGPIKGYLRVVDKVVEIVPHSSQASYLSIIEIPTVEAFAVRHNDRQGMFEAFSAPRAGEPILVRPLGPIDSVWMRLKKTDSRKGSFDFW